MKHLLFVDHEPRILERINRMLGHRQAEWAMEFASQPHLAFEAIDRQQYDIIVCDVNFPGRRGGFALLEEPRTQGPGLRCNSYYHRGDPFGCLNSYNFVFAFATTKTLCSAGATSPYLYS